MLSLKMKSHCFFFCTILLSFSTRFTISDARRFNVGGNGAWVPKPPENYETWAGKSRFLVHDTLYFNYAKGADSVLEVNKADYDGCNTKNPIRKMEDGESEVSLDRSGPFYFITGNEDNCKKGQKLTVVVLSVTHAAAPGHSSPEAHSPKSSSHVSPVTSPPAHHHPPRSSSPVSPSSAPVTSPPGSMPPKSDSIVSPPAPQPPKPSSPVSPSSAPVTSPPGPMAPDSFSPVSPSSAPVTSPPGSMAPKSFFPGSPSSAPSKAHPPKSSSPVSNSPAVSPSLSPGPSSGSLSPSDSPLADSPSSYSPTESPPSLAPSGSAISPSGDGPSASGDITTPAAAPGQKKSSANGMAIMSVTTVLSLVLIISLSA